ncbi:MAG: CAP domain-containing protein [Burkholderiales bacterium]
MVLTLVLSACGGGGATEASAGTSTAPGGSSVASTAASTGAGASPSAGSASASTDCGLGAFEVELLRQINAQRAAGASCGSRGNYAATTALAWHNALGVAAAGHAQDTASNQFLSHSGSDGSSFDQRISAAGYAWSAAAENIAMGYPSVSAVVAGWMGSDGHCANLMSPQLQHVGGACARASTASLYWALDLAAPR